MSERERTPQANIAPFGLRMQPELKAKVEEAARGSERSMNAEIVARLQDSFQPESTSDLRNKIIAMERYIDTLERMREAMHASSSATKSLSEIYEDNLAELQGRLDQIAGVSRFVAKAIEEASQGDAWNIKALAEQMHPFQDHGIPNNPEALLARQYEFGLARLSDAPDEERAAAHARLVELIEGSAELLGVDWEPPKGDHDQ